MRKVSSPNLWFRVRHPDGFTPAVFDHFKAACRVCHARIESLIANWDDLAPTKGKTKPGGRVVPRRAVRGPLYGEPAYEYRGPHHRV